MGPMGKTLKDALFLQRYSMLCGASKDEHAEKADVAVEHAHRMAEALEAVYEAAKAWAICRNRGGSYHAECNRLEEAVEAARKVMP